MLRTLLFSSLLLPCFTAADGASPQSVKGRISFFSPLRCCWHPCVVPDQKRIPWRRGVCALSGPPTSLPEIWWHFSFSVGFRRALVWFLCVWSPHTSDVAMFQYWSKPFLWLCQILVLLASTEKSKFIFSGHRGIHKVYFSYYMRHCR